MEQARQGRGHPPRAEAARAPLSAGLPPRLAAIAEHVLPGGVLADIGTDHGRLVVALVRSGHVERAIATDAAPAALARARALVTTWDLQARIALRLGNGLRVLTAHDHIATVVVAGLGGGRAQRILDGERLDELGVRRLVVQVNRDREALLSHLAGQGWPRVHTTDGPPGRWQWQVDVLTRAR